MDAVDMEIDVPLESGEDSPSAGGEGIPERSAKRPRLAGENEEENDGSPQESSAMLPPEVWARVMERKYYIVYVCKEFLLVFVNWERVMERNI